MDEPPFSLAFVMGFAVPAIFFYLASDANKNKLPDHLNRILSDRIRVRARKEKLLENV
jgi:hypothetical protein